MNRINLIDDEGKGELERIKREQPVVYFVIDRFLRIGEKVYDFIRRENENK